MGKEKKTKRTFELVVYNANDASLFTVTHCEGCILSKEQFLVIETVCRKGPYFAFFHENLGGPSHVYRLRGPYQGLDPFYVIDSTGLAMDDTQKQIIELLKRRVQDIKENF